VDVPMTSFDIQDLQEQWLGGSETEIVYIFYRIEHFQEILQINYQEKIFEKIFRHYHL
jgi:hypothetical protein